MIYFMRGVDTKLIKIGLTEDLEQRVKQVGEKVEVLGVVAVETVEDRELEKRLHEKFKHLAVFGEWFADDGSIEGVVAGLLDLGMALGPDEAVAYSKYKIESERMNDNIALDNEKWTAWHNRLASAIINTVPPRSMTAEQIEKADIVMLPPGHTLVKVEGIPIAFKQDQNFRP